MSTTRATKSVTWSIASLSEHVRARVCVKSRRMRRDFYVLRVLGSRPPSRLSAAAISAARACVAAAPTARARRLTAARAVGNVALTAAGQLAAAKVATSCQKSEETTATTRCRGGGLVVRLRGANGCGVRPDRCPREGPDAPRRDFALNGQWRRERCHRATRDTLFLINSTH
jgi:hypothetical protein